MLYEQSQAEKRTAVYTNPLEDDLMAKDSRKTFMTAAYYLGTAVGLFIVYLAFPDIEGTTQDKEVLAVFGRIGIALVAASAVLMLALYFARGLSKTLMFILNWLVLPAVLIEGLLELADIFIKGVPKI
jgi:predicted membrane channel-forming protein YqfA (hemolysin III family)